MLFYYLIRELKPLLSECEHFLRTSVYMKSFGFTWNECKSDSEWRITVLVRSKQSFEHMEQNYGRFCLNKLINYFITAYVKHWTVRKSKMISPKGNGIGSTEFAGVINHDNISEHHYYLALRIDFLLEGSSYCVNDLRHTFTCQSDLNFIYIFAWLAV